MRSLFGLPDVSTSLISIPCTPHMGQSRVMHMAAGFQDCLCVCISVTRQALELLEHKTLKLIYRCSLSIRNLNLFNIFNYSHMLLYIRQLRIICHQICLLERQNFETGHGSSTSLALSARAFLLAIYTLKRMENGQKYWYNGFVQM